MDTHVAGGPVPKGVQPPFVLRLLITLQVAHVDIELIPGPQKPAAGRNLGLKPPLLSLSFNGGQLLLNMQRFSQQWDHYQGQQRERGADRHCGHPGELCSFYRAIRVGR